MFRSLALIAVLTLPATHATALTCGEDAGGFERWKQDFAAEAAAQGVGSRGIDALMRANYSNATIRLDRAVRRETRPFDEIWRVRGGDQLAQQGRQRLAENRAFFDGLEARFGVPAEYIVAIHGWETNFGSDLRFVEIPIVSAITTVAYDCRRPDMFYPHAIATLKLIDAGRLSADKLGAGHGEWGHTQFLPGNALQYGLDGNGDGQIEMNDWPDALASTANFLNALGWRPGADYHEGGANFEVMYGWNRGTNYRMGVAKLADLIGG